MATLQGMSGTDVRAEVAELSALLPLWIGKIYQYDTASFGFRLNGEEKARHLLFVEKVSAQDTAVITIAAVKNIFFIVGYNCSLIYSRSSRG